jgi:hypothetical protein
LFKDQGDLFAGVVELIQLPTRLVGAQPASSFLRLAWLFRTAWLRRWFGQVHHPKGGIVSRFWPKTALFHRR